MKVGERGAVAVAVVVAVGRRWRIGVGRRVVLARVALVVVLSLLAAAPVVGAQEATTGRYEVTGLVFGTAEDGMVGRPTASGQRLVGEDRLVGLPGCTVSSCPWVAPGEGVGGEWGPQTSCADEDGLCWVELTNPATGSCATAPVLDLGPFFVRDNWWAPTAERSYGLPQGEPAVARAALGADLGFGPGLTDDGYDATATPFPAAINVAAGTWADLGLEASDGAAPLVVRLLWQAATPRSAACDGASWAEANATALDDLSLRIAADQTSEVVGTVALGSRLRATGGSDAGFVPVMHGGRDGWVAAESVLLDSAPPAVVAEAVNLRTEPSAEGMVVGVLPAGTAVLPTGPAEGGYLPVRSDAGDGWVAGAYVRFG